MAEYVMLAVLTDITGCMVAVTINVLQSVSARVAAPGELF